MSSFEASSKLKHLSRRSVILLGAAGLAACGFEPVYGPGGDARDLRGRIAFLPPVDEEGFALVRRLQDRLGRPEQGDLTFAADIYISEEAVGFLPDNSISRYAVQARIDWTLEQGETVVLSGSDRSFTGYSATSTTVATLVAQRDARERAMVLIADRIVADILSRSDQL